MTPNKDKENTCKENSAGVTYHIPYKRQSFFPSEIWHTVNTIKSPPSPDGGKKK